MKLMIEGSFDDIGFDLDVYGATLGEALSAIDDGCVPRNEACPFCGRLANAIVVERREAGAALAATCPCGSRLAVSIRDEGCGGRFGDPVKAVDDYVDALRRLGSLFRGDRIGEDWS